MSQTQLLETAFFDYKHAVGYLIGEDSWLELSSIEQQILHEGIEEALQKINKLRQKSLAQIREEDYQKAYLEGKSDRTNNPIPKEVEDIIQKGLKSQAEYQEPLKLTGPMVSIPTTFFSKDHSDDLDEGNH